MADAVRGAAHGNRDDHSHGETDASHASRTPLANALGITLAFLVAEVIGGIMTRSLALLADAGHMATDAAALPSSEGST